MAEPVGKVLWSQEAVDDLDSITDFILKDSPRYAEIVGDALISEAESALNAPYHGRMVPELENPLIRERLVYSYRIIYHVIEHDEGHNIAIIAMTSCSQLLIPLIDKRTL